MARKCLMKCVFPVRYCKIETLVSAPEADRMIYVGRTYICDDRSFYCEGRDRKRSSWASRRLTQRQRRWESVWQ